MSATTDVPASITTPDTVQASRLGTLEFNDGAPTPETAGRLYDNLDFSRGVEAFLKTWRPSEFEPCSPGSNGHSPTTGH